MQISPGSLESLYWSYSTIYQKAFTAPKTVYQEIAMTVPSATKEQVHVWMDLLPKLREWVGPRVVNNLIGRSYRLANKKFEHTSGVSREHLEDDQHGVFSPWVQMVGREAAIWPDREVADVIEDAITENCFDGNPFFYNAHLTNVSDSSSTTYQNRFDDSANGGGVAYPLTGENLMTVYQTMTAYKGADNEPMGIVPDVLMVPPQLRGRATQLCELEYIAQAVGSNAAQMQQNVVKGWLRPVVNPFLTDADRWYVLVTNLPVRPFVWQLRVAPEFTPRFNPSDPSVFDLDQFLFGVRARGAAGVSLPFLAATASA